MKTFSVLSEEVNSFIPYLTIVSDIFSLLATKTFHFVLPLVLLFDIFPNLLTTSPSHYLGSIRISRFGFLRDHSMTPLVNLQSVNLVTYPAQQKFCFCYSAITSFNSLRPQIIVTNNILSMNLSITLFTGNNLRFFLLCRSPRFVCT